jgi:hypothetical protein
MARLLSAVLNEANPNKIPDALKDVGAGSTLGLVARSARITVVAGTGVGALPEGAKAAAVIRARVSAGGVVGAFTCLETDAAPATTQAGVNALGNIQFLIADAVTEAEVVYFVAEGVIRDETLAVAANIAVLPSGVQARQLITAFDGATGAAKVVVARGNAPGAGNVSISVDGDSIRVGDAIASIRVRYIAFPITGTSLNEKIQSSVNY